MPTNKLATISRQPDSRSTEQVVREWLVKLAELHRKNAAPYPLTPILTQLWIDALVDLDAGVCDGAFCDLVNVGCRREFPIPADVRAQVDQAQAKGFDLEAEREWQNLLEWIRASFYPDGITVNGCLTHIRPGAPTLSGATAHAARAAGGYSYLEQCSKDELVWARKNFLAAYKNVHETGLAAHLLSDGEAKRILMQFAAPPPRPQPKQIAAPTTNGEKPSRSEVRSVLNRVVAPQARPEISEEEWQARKNRQAGAVREWRVAHGLPPEPSQKELDAAAAIGRGMAVPKTPAPMHPQVIDFMRPEISENAVPKTHGFETAEARP